jgi:hypothetical protein
VRADWLNSRVTTDCPRPKILLSRYLVPIQLGGRFLEDPRGRCLSSVTLVNPGGGTQWHAGEDLSRVVGRVGLEPTTQGL